MSHILIPMAVIAVMMVLAKLLTSFIKKKADQQLGEEDTFILDQSDVEAVEEYFRHKREKIAEADAIIAELILEEKELIKSILEKYQLDVANFTIAQDTLPLVKIRRKPNGNNKMHVSG